MTRIKIWYASGIYRTVCVNTMLIQNKTNLVRHLRRFCGPLAGYEVLNRVA